MLARKDEMVNEFTFEDTNRNLRINTNFNVLGDYVFDKNDLVRIISNYIQVYIQFCSDLDNLSRNIKHDTAEELEKIGIFLTNIRITTFIPESSEAKVVKFSKSVWPK